MKKILAALAALALCASVAVCIGFVSCSSDTESEDVAETLSSAAEKAADDEGSSADEQSSQDEEPQDESSQEEESQDDTSEESEKNSDDEVSQDDAAEDESVEESADEEEKEDEPSETAEDGYSNEVYSVKFDTEKWVSLTEFKELIAKLAADKTEQLDTGDYSSIMSGIYYCADDVEADYPTNIIFANPVYDASLTDYSIVDIKDLMVQSVEAQLQAVDYVQVVSNEIVNHSGVDMLKIQTHGESGSAVYDCDEYIFLKDGNTCVLSVNYGTEGSGKADFEKMLDELSFE